MNSESRDDVMVLTIPITKNLDTVFPDSVIIPADEETKLASPGQAQVFALTSCDRNWFMEERRRGRVGEKEWNQIENKLKGLIGVDSKKIIIGNTAFSEIEIKQIMTDRGHFKTELEKRNADFTALKTKHDELNERSAEQLNEQRKRIHGLEREVGQLHKDIDILKTELETRQSEKAEEEHHPRD